MPATGVHSLQTLWLLWNADWVHDALVCGNCWKVTYFLWIYRIAWQHQQKAECTVVDNPNTPLKDSPGAPKRLLVFVNLVQSCTCFLGPSPCSAAHMHGALLILGRSITCFTPASSHYQTDVPCSDSTRTALLRLRFSLSEILYDG